ncbi:MAG: trigger factor [Candidatus Parcubacteria bacterium]|jgi:trigger factor
MNTPTIKHLPGGKAALTFTISPEEAQPYIDEAVRVLQEAKPIPGFRPGKASYAEVAKAFSEMRIWETALERVVRASYLKALIDLDLDTVGSPEIQVEKLVPGHPISFTATAPLMPRVEKLADVNASITEYSARTVSDEEVDKALTDLRRMQRKEVRTLEAATKDHLVILDLGMKRENVPLEGGAGRDYRVFLGEEHYIPGFTEKLIGMNEGEERTFTLKFPDGHYQKHLSGQDVDFTAKATGIFRLEMPALDEAFAKSLGQESVDALNNVLRENLNEEEAERARQKCEIAMLEALVDASTFTDIPEILVNEEVRKMVAELEHSLEERGMNTEDYLTSIKKTLDTLRMEFVPQAIRRVKTATLIKEVAKRENIAVTDAEIDHDLDHILDSLRPDDTQTRERVTSPEYREYMGIMLRNQKTLELLKGRCIKGYVPRKPHVHGGHEEKE